MKGIYAIALLCIWAVLCHARQAEIVSNSFAANFGNTIKNGDTDDVKAVAWHPYTGNKLIAYLSVFEFARNSQGENAHNARIVAVRVDDKNKLKSGTAKLEILDVVDISSLYSVSNVAAAGLFVTKDYRQLLFSIVNVGNYQLKLVSDTTSAQFGQFQAGTSPVKFSSTAYYNHEVFCPLNYMCVMVRQNGELRYLKLASRNQFGENTIIEINTNGVESTAYPGNGFNTPRVRFSPDGKFIFVLKRFYNIEIFEVDTVNVEFVSNTKIAEIVTEDDLSNPDLDNRIESMELSRDGKRLFVLFQTRDGLNKGERIETYDVSEAAIRNLPIKRIGEPLHLTETATSFITDVRSLVAGPDFQYASNLFVSGSQVDSKILSTYYNPTDGKMRWFGNSDTSAATRVSQDNVIFPGAFQFENTISVSPDGLGLIEIANNSPDDRVGVQLYGLDYLSTASPTRSPTQSPTRSPTRPPTKYPTISPTGSPTPRVPTTSPVVRPTTSPQTFQPTRSPTPAATEESLIKQDWFWGAVGSGIALLSAMSGLVYCKCSKPTRSDVYTGSRSSLPKAEIVEEFNPKLDI